MWVLIDATLWGYQHKSTKEIGVVVYGSNNTEYRYCGYSYKQRSGVYWKNCKEGPLHMTMNDNENNFIAM